MADAASVSPMPVCGIPVRAVLACAAVVLLSCPGPVRSQCCYNEMDLNGTYRSAGPEPLQDGGFGVRELRFTPKTWTLTFTHYADGELRHPVFTVVAEGTYTINEMSGKVQNSYNAAFRSEKRTLTLRTADQDAIRRLGLGGCGSTQGEIRDISHISCSFFRSLEESPVEYDLVSLEGDMLFLGERPADGNMSTDARRPTKLGPPLRKAASRN